jgi:hypothetical protein
MGRSVCTCARKIGSAVRRPRQRLSHGALTDPDRCNPTSQAPARSSRSSPASRRVHSERPSMSLLVLFEPYGVAGHLAAQIAGVPPLCEWRGAMLGGCGAIHSSKRSMITY